MAPQHLEAYRDGQLARGLSHRIRAVGQGPIRLMEVCGTHTVAIFRSGIRSVLPPDIALLSGPGCPVCVTAQGEIDAFVALSRKENVIVTTFGDLMRVPGSASSLLKEKASGRDIRMVYSTMDAVQIAREHPSKQVVFLGVGFETTAPTVAAAIVTAARSGIGNFSVLSAHKRVPPALMALGTDGSARIDGFILPGHVSVVIGTDAYRPFFDRCRIPSVVAGFEPTDILQAILTLAEQIRDRTPRLENLYRRAVTDQGNPKALEIMDTVFETTDADWRGIGRIAGSGLGVRPALSAHDARRVFDLEILEVAEPKGCACGAILTGTRTPPDCPLFRTVCTPTEPVGPCMVSSEGTCAAYHRYHHGR